MFLLFIQLFEGMKAFHGVDGKARLFRPMENMKRLNSSAVTMSLPVRDEVFCATTQESKNSAHTCVQYSISRGTIFLLHLAEPVEVLCAFSQYS